MACELVITSTERTRPATFRWGLFYDFLNLSGGIFQFEIQFMFDILISEYCAILSSTGGPFCLTTVETCHHNMTLTLNHFISSKSIAVSTTYMTFPTYFWQMCWCRKVQVEPHCYETIIMFLKHRFVGMRVIWKSHLEIEVNLMT